MPVKERRRIVKTDQDLYVHMLEADLANTVIRLARALYGLPHGTTLEEAVEELDRRGEKVPFTTPVKPASQRDEDRLEQIAQDQLAGRHEDEDLYQREDRMYF
jgi:hypothetical protein